MSAPAAKRPAQGEKLAKAGGPAEVRVWLRLLSVTMTLEKRLRRRFADEFATTLPRFDVMAALDREPAGLTMSALSRALLVSNGNVTAIVRQLEGEQVVETRSDPADARASVVSLTEHGQAWFDALAAAHHGWIADAFAGLDGPERDALYALLGKLRQSVADAL